METKVPPSTRKLAQDRTAPTSSLQSQQPSAAHLPQPSAAPTQQPSISRLSLGPGAPRTRNWGYFDVRRDRLFSGADQCPIGSCLFPAPGSLAHLDQCRRELERVVQVHGHHHGRHASATADAAIAADCDMSLDIAFAKRLTEKPELMARLRAGRLFQLSGGCWGGEVSGAHLNADEAGADDNGTNAEDNVDGDGPRSSDDEDDNERNDDEHNDDEGNDDEVASLNDGPDTDKEGEEPNDHANAKRGKIRGRKRALNTLLVAPLIMGNADGSVVSVMAETSAAAETTVTSSMATTETLSTPTTATPPNKSTPTLVEFINNHCASKSYTPRNLPPETEYYKRKRLKEEKKNLSTSSAATQGAPSASTASPVDKTPQIARRRNASHHAGALACDEWFAWLTAIQSTFAWSPLETLKTQSQFWHEQRIMTSAQNLIRNPPIYNMSQTTTTSTTTQKDTRVQASQSLFRVAFFSANRPAHKIQEYLLLGTQTLADLRDALFCPVDSMAATWTTPLENARRRHSALFCINNCFYTDTRDAHAVDYSKQIEAAMRSVDVSAGGRYNRGTMQTTQLKDVAWRVNLPYPFVHQGMCEHSIVITDIRLFNAAEDPPMTSMYPALLFQINNPVHLTQCCTFCPAPATKFTLFDDLAAVNAAHFCEECFEELHGADMERCNRDWFVYDAVSAVQGLAHIVDRVRALGGTVEK